MNEYSAIQLEDKAFHICRDGSHLTCPKTAIAIPRQSRVQGAFDLNVTKFNCSTQCPFACIKTKKVSDDDGSGKYHEVNVYEITCEGGKKELELTEIIPLKEKKIPIIGQAVSD